MVQHSTQLFVNALKNLDVPPRETEITFGIKVSGEIGNFVIAKSSGEVNYHIKLVWKFEK